ncbi:hypothetical protein RFI_25543 [Reticulomyxa filosa]|uniref:Exocyst subunit Exo70 family protein n=1 Tax=Reticulomyxa filosa TaxID=46433 RepID=X6MFM2_RETFI|nr:hypothetical protein RFI_25543 [Reticulomyxa filosa]|eukprot:ETO11835.1 hypothetical protein RFI_25543 [Reticulomyxa filosa]
MALNAKLNTGLERLQLSVEILHHPVIPFVVLGLMFMQMERHLCEKVLRKSNNKSAVGYNVKPTGSSQFDAIVTVCANIANNSGNMTATNVVLIKLDLVRTWHLLTPAFEEAFNTNGKKWEELDELLNENNSKKKKTNRRIPPMVYVRQLRKRIDMDTLKTIDARIQKIADHRENKPRPDGGYHPLTIETVELITNVYAFRNTVEELYQNFNNELERHDDSDAAYLEGPLYKYEVLSEIMKALQGNLQEKSKQYGNSKVLRLVFLMNNYHYIVKCIGDTPLEEACGKTEMDSLRKDIADLKKKYLKESWGKIDSCLDEHDQLSKKTTNLKRGERDAVKKKFKSFNDEFVAQHSLQTKYSVPDSSLRADLQERNKKYFGVRYTEMWRRYENVDFTNNKSKYFIYPPKQLEAMLDQFFEPN